MPAKKPAWAVWEETVNSALGLRGTISSGSKWYDPADGVTPEGHPIPMMLDAKSTERKSFSLRHDMLNEWESRAAEQGKLFGLPIRFENAAGNRDFMVLSFTDFESLWSIAQAYIKEN